MNKNDDYKTFAEDEGGEIVIEPLAIDEGGEIVIEPLAMEDL